MHPIVEKISQEARGVWRFRRYALITAWAVCLIGWFVVFIIPDTFEARARVNVDTKTPLQPLLRDIAVDNDVPTQLNIVRQALLGATTLDAVAHKLGLDGAVRLLRPGAVTLSQLRGVVGEVQIGADKSSPRVPGSAPAHYAPATPLTIVPGGEIDALAESLSEGGQRIAVLAQRLPLKTYQYVTWINAGKRAEAFGHDLYANLRTLDKAGCARILVQEVPGDERWDAVRDRLARGAVGAAADSGRYSALGTGVLP